ncbi:MAG: HNH endonuclease domain-containing protein [Ferruginibacter sp.]
MQLLPENRILPINKLIACFNNTSATYKFYWLLSIIQQVEAGKTMILKKELFATMIGNAWYTINYFQVSFGKQDLFQQKIERLRKIEEISVDLRRDEVIRILSNSENPKTLQILTSFNAQVPHWFLSPWFPKATKHDIYKGSKEFKNLSPYELHNEFISINILWFNYFVENAALIKDFCYWNLAMFLQQKNPNVPDIAGKLIKPAFRNNLNKQRKFWDIVIEESGGSVQCIYKNCPLTVNNYAVEHFVPYSFVSHDLIWNLIPADRSFNSSKSDRLPQMELYFDQFFDLQKRAIIIIKDKQPRNKFLEDYLTIFPSFKDLDNEFTKEKFKERILPLITIAANNGFEFLQ